MSEWKLLSWKSLSILLTLILIPFIISLVANYTTWLRTRDEVEITMKLDGWITIGAIQGNDISDLKLTYKDQAVGNAMKVSWRLINTGSKGIPAFEQPPAIAYPRDLKVIEPRISETSPLLKVGRQPRVLPGLGWIVVDSLGVFNPGDFIRLDVFVLDLPASEISANYFSNWDFVVKSVDHRKRIDLSSQVHSTETGREAQLIESNMWLLRSLAFGIILFAVVNILLLGRVRKEMKL